MATDLPNRSPLRVSESLNTAVASVVFAQPLEGLAQTNAEPGQPLLGSSELESISVPDETMTVPSRLIASRLPIWTLLASSSVAVRTAFCASVRSAPPAPDQPVAGRLKINTAPC